MFRSLQNLMGSQEEAAVTQPVKKKARLAPQAALPPIHANKALRFHFVSSIEQMPASAADLKADSGHEALFTNQTFGEDEEIIGYEGLQIAIVFTKSTLTPLLLHKYNTKQSPANDYVTLLSKEFGAGLHASADAAAGADVQKKLPSLSTTLEDPCITTISQATTKKGITSHILQFNLTAAAAPLRMLHARLHPLLRFYIDACSELEQTDERLEVLLAVQIEAGAPTAVLGMLTFFKFWTYPHALRYRVAQILVLPWCQGQGIGGELLRALNSVAAADDACKDVTYEDPAEDLQALRERIDLERCAPVAAIWQPAQAAVAAALQARSTLDSATTTGGASNGGDAAAGELSAAEVQAKVGAHTVITALQPPQAAVEAMATLQISLHQVPLVWDTLLWAAGLAPADVGTGQQREMAELLKCRILHRSLVSLLEPPKHGVSSAQGSEDLGEDDEDEDDAGGDGAVKLPDNKVYVDFEAEGAEKEMLAEKRAQLTAALHGLAGGGNGNSAAIEGALDGLLGGTGGDDGDIDKDSVDDDEDEIREEEGRDGEGEQDDAEGGDQKWRTTSPRLLIYRTDPRSRAQRTAARAAAVAVPLRLPPLNGEVLQSLNSLVRDRLGAIDRIVRSAQIGAAQ